MATLTYTLARDGQRPVRFSGTLLSAACGAVAHGKRQNRYYNVALYQHADGRYLVHWEYRTRWQGEEQHSAVEVYPTLSAAGQALEAFDPTAWVMGYKAILARHPAYAQDDSPRGYRQRQEALEQALRARYRAQVSALCEDFDLAEDRSSLTPPALCRRGST